MSVTLIQSQAAGFKDRPVGGGYGLLVRMNAGRDGAYLEQTLDESLAVLHTRVMMKPVSASGGSVALLVGWSLAQDETWLLTLDADAMTVTLKLPGGQTLTAALIAQLDWHCVEVRVDAAAGEAALWINGVSAQTQTGLSGLSATASLWLGGMYKDDAAAGDVWLDEWVIADQYIGPVAVEPGADDASDPARWVAIYNADDADSSAWAGWYRQQRGLPYANLIGLVLPGDEATDETTFTAMREAVRQYLDDNGLSEQVLGIVCGHGVPGQYVSSYGQVESVTDRLHRLEGDSTAEANPLFDAGALRRLTEGNRQGLRLTARIDGPTLTDSQAITQRAMAIEAGGLGDGSEAKFWLDAITTGSMNAFTQQRMLDWAAGNDRRALRLPLEMTEATQPESEVSFTSIDHDAFFIGWRAATVPEGFFGQPAGRRVFAMQLENGVATAGSLRSGSCWAKAAMDAGYAASGGTTQVISVTDVPWVGPMMKALRRGWTLAEAWFAAREGVGVGLTLVGDPLMTVRFGQAGWNVYGPFEDWASARFDTPALLLREDESDVTLDDALQPPDGQVSLYVIRHVDEQGREEAGVRHVCVERDGEQLRRLAMAMSWPRGPGWRPAAAVGEQWRFDASWPVTLAAAGVERVRLIEQLEGGTAAPVQEVQVTATMGRSQRITLLQAMHAQPARYRLQASSAHGGVISSAWSAWVRDEAAAVGAVTLLAEGV